MARKATPTAPKQALEYFRKKGYKQSFSYQDVWKTEHRRAFTVAKATSQGLLIDIRKSVDRAIAEGKTLDDFKQDLFPKLQKRGWLGYGLMDDPVLGGTDIYELGTPRRLKIIYETNMRVSRAAGQWERIKKTQAALPYLIYSLGPSKEHRPDHEGWAGTLLPVGDTFWNTHFPPNGWGCKCKVRPITRGETKKRGGTTTRPSRSTVPWTNARTGAVERVPIGIDPGWNYNPGIGTASQKAVEKHGKDVEKVFKKVVKPIEKPKPKPAPGYWDTSTDKGRWHEQSFKDSPDQFKRMIKAWDKDLHEVTYHTTYNGKECGAFYHKYWGDNEKGVTVERFFINMKNYKKNEGGAHSNTWRHEYGHFIDEKIGAKRGMEDHYILKGKKQIVAIGHISNSHEFKSAAELDKKLFLNAAGYGRKSKANDKRFADSEKRHNDLGQEITKIKGDKDGFGKVRKVAKDLAKDVGVDFDDFIGGLKEQTIWGAYGNEEVYSRAAHTLLAMKNNDAKMVLRYLSGIDLSNRNRQGSYETRLADKDREGKNFDKGSLGNYCDTIGSASKNIIGGHNKETGGRGHRTSYYERRDGAAETESWANITDMLAGPNPGFWEPILKATTPKMLKEYKKIMEEEFGK